MSNADTEEVVTAASDGVTVEKSFEPDDFPVPAIAFVIRSERDEAVSVRLVDSVPDGVAAEDVGFHPKYGAEFWDVEGETIVFEREFDPDEEYTTVYGLRGGDAENPERFLSEPDLEEVDPPLAADSGQVVRDVIDSDASAAADDEETEEAPAVSLDLADPDDESTGDGADAGGVELGGDGDEDATADAVGTDDATSDDSGTDDSEAAGDAQPVDLAGVDTADAGATPQVAADSSLVAALAAELRRGDVDEDAVVDLRDALGVDLASASVGARIDHLQSAVADLEAYTEALEAFLDEEGTAEQVLEGLRDEVAATQDRLDEIEETAESALETAEAVDDELEAVHSSVDDAAADATAAVEATESLREDLESLESDVGEATEARLDELESSLEDLEAELSDVAEMRDRLASALGGLASGGVESDDDG